MAVDSNANSPKCVILALIDIGKAYNRSSHLSIIEDLYAMNVPGLILALIFSYLKDRKMLLKFNNVPSIQKSFPSGLGQGCYLSVILFIILINEAFLHPPIRRPLRIRNDETKPEENFLAQKFIDDCAAAAVIELKTSLVKEDREMP